MNISYNWLKDLIEFDLSVDELSRRLTGVGLAVEGIHQTGSDQILDIDLTSNRPDCLSHLGVAREIGVITGRDVSANVAIDRETTIPLPSLLANEIVRVDDAVLCPRFTARIIKGVKIGPSPHWLVDRLEAIGERSINNVADITNYVMHELGQPMHSFDLDKLAGQKIIVRRAKPAEAIKTLDEADRELDDTMLVICDAEKPVAVAGVMGGYDSAISDSTVNVLLEVAYFERESIRATSRKLKLATEASYRFERGVDVENLLRASQRATDLICQLAGGTAGDLVDIYSAPQERTQVYSRNISAAVERLTGLTVAEEECRRILGSLGFKTIESDGTPGTTFTSPSWRHDVAIEEDLVEEVARHVGYDSIRSELPPALGAGEYQANEVRKRRLRQTLSDLGFDEAISYSFINTDLDDVFEPVAGLLNASANEKYVTLQDSVIEGAIRMRPTALPGLLTAVKLNFNHQRRDVKLLEIGKVFAGEPDADELPNEQEVLTLAMTGGETVAGHAAPARDLDVYDLKGAIEAALAAAGVPELSFVTSDVKHLRPGQAAAIDLHGQTIGYLGRLADEVMSLYKFKQPVYVCEINLQEALVLPQPKAAYSPLPKFPGIVRDISLITARNVSFEQIKHEIERQGFELLRSVGFVDVYEGKGMAAGERSITLRLEYRSDERTLIEDEVEAVHHQIISRLAAAFDIKQRT